MKLGVVLLTLLPLASALGRTQEQPRLLDRVVPLPMALNEDFRFRKTKLYLLTENAPGQEKSIGTDSTQGRPKGGKLASTAPSSRSTTVQDASIRFERQHRLFGAVTRLDQRERFGNYFDFFWRSRRAADLTIGLEYRQENIECHIKCQVISSLN